MVAKARIAVASSVLGAFLLGNALTTAPAHAQDEAREAARTGIRLYKNGEYEEALRRLRRAADQADQLESIQRALVHKYIAFCKIAFDEPDDAQFHFKRALTYDPEMELDPIRTSPKIREVFDQAKGEATRNAERQPEGGGPPNGGDGTRNGGDGARKGGDGARNATGDNAPGGFFGGANPQATGALWRSAAAPGWGQFHSERPMAGYVAVGANAVALGSAAWLTYWSARAHGYAVEVKRSGTRQPPVVEDARRFHRYRNVAIGAAVGVWTLTAVEAYANGRWYARDSSPSKGVALRLAPVVTPQNQGLVLSGTF